MRGMIDSVYIPILVFALLIVFSFSYFIFVKISEPLYQATGVSIFQMATSQQVSNAFKLLMIAVYFGIPAIGIILSFLSGINPIFLPIGIIFLIINPFIYGILKEVMVQFFQTDSFFLTFWSDPILSKLLNYYPLIMTIFGGAIIFLQFIVSRE
jgi:hypothetical protein